MRLSRAISLTTGIFCFCLMIVSYNAFMFEIAIIEAVVGWFFMILGLYTEKEDEKERK